MKPLISLALLGCILLTGMVAPAQPRDMRPLQPGDTAPPALMALILSSIGQKEGGANPELVLVPFWSSSCGSSKKLLPRLLQLEKELGGRLAVLPANKEAAAPIDSLWQREDQGRWHHTPQLRGDTVLHHYFPYVLVPHVVWLQPTGKVVAITAGDVATRYYITALLAGTAPPLPLKQDVMDYEPDQPLLTPDSFLRYHSLIQAYRPGLPGQLGYQRERDGRQYRAYATNMSLPALYSLAFIQAGELPPNRWQWRIQDTGRLHFRGAPHEAPAWNARNLFSYELRLPGLPPEKLAPHVQQDLDRYFGFSSRLEMHRVTCWVLRRRAGTPGGGTATETIPGASETHFQLVRRLNSRPGAPPLIDETGLKRPVRLHLHGSPTDFRDLKRALRRQGFQLEKERRRLAFVVITEAP